MSEKAIVVSNQGSGFAVEIPGEMIQRKSDALEAAAVVRQVTNQHEQAGAVFATSFLKGLSAQAEKDREAVKKPFWDAGKAIDAKAKEYVKEIDARAAELEKMIADFQRKEAAKVQAQKDEQMRQMREAEIALANERRKMEEIERQKKLAEIQATEARTKKAREAAAAEAKRLEAERFQAELDRQEAEDDAAQASATVVLPEPPKAEGAAVKISYDFEVTDLNLVYAWKPYFVKMEVKRGDLLKFINMDGVNPFEIPGIKVTEKTSVAVRAVNPALTLQ